MTNKPIQQILFGSPGTGKSHRIVKQEQGGKLFDLGIEKDSENHIATVFHPEYTYGDFMGKLLPLTVRDKEEDEKSKVTYNYYEGHFLKALAQAYRNIIIAFLNQSSEANTEDEEDSDPQISTVIVSKVQNVTLIIDEINRGNSAAIFGTVFQLLDRVTDISNPNFGWSAYTIQVSKMEFNKLTELVGLKWEEETKSKDKKVVKYRFDYKKTSRSKPPVKELNEWLEILKIKEYQIKLPPNLSLFATMNTSDNSIYFMDNAFKRRWDWEFVDVDDDAQRESVAHRKVMLYRTEKCTWVEFVGKLNDYIRSKHKDIRKIEDKQIGYRFINEEVITEEHLKNKLMFFLWDSVFSNNKKPLAELLGISESEIVTFGQFTRKEQVENFVDKILNR